MLILPLLLFIVATQDGPLLQTFFLIGKANLDLKLPNTTSAIDELCSAPEFMTNESSKPNEIGVEKGRSNEAGRLKKPEENKKTMRKSKSQTRVKDAKKKNNEILSEGVPSDVEN